MIPVLHVLLVAREPVGRLGLETLIEREGMIVSGSTETATDAAELAGTVSADVILVARFLGRVPVTDDVRMIHAAAPAVPILVLGSTAGLKELNALVDAGASGWISARAPTNEIAAALRAVRAGLFVVARSSRQALVGAPGVPTLPPPSEAPRRIEPGSFSEREREVLRRLAQGEATATIAAAMGLSEETVKRAVQALTAKLADQFPASRMRGEIA